MAQVFQERLRGVRQSKGLSQKKAAIGLGLTDTGYHNYEVGVRRPTFEILPRLADFYGVSIDYLLGRSDDPHLPRMDKETRDLFMAVKAMKEKQKAELQAQQAQEPPKEPKE